MTDDATRRTERPAGGDPPARGLRDRTIRPFRLAACVVVLAAVAGGIATLPGYGVTCDEAYGYLFFGERYLYYSLTHDRAYLDFQNADLPIHRREPNLFASIGRVHPQQFPPLADTLSAGTMELLGHRLGWMDPIDGFHVATILLVGLLLAALFEFAAPRIGSATALAGIALLAFHPRFWADMHNNPKDIPELVFFALSVMAAARWYARPGVGKALVAGAIGGAALAVKANAVFVPIVVILGLWPWRGAHRVPSGRAPPEAPVVALRADAGGLARG